MLYFKYFRIVLKSQMQYRSSFILSMISQVLIPLSNMAGVVLLFQRFHRLGDWTLTDVLLLFAVTHMAFAISECFARGFDLFSQLVQTGDFDRILIRPRSTIMQILGARIEFSRFGRLVFSALVLAAAVRFADISWTPVKMLTLMLMIGSGSLIFFAIFMFAATLCFWTVQGLEVVNIFTDGGREIAQYPLDIYRKEITRFFTFIIPFAAVNYLPLRFLLGLPGCSIWQAFVPLVSVIFLLPGVLAWRYGVNHYQSTGS